MGILSTALAATNEPSLAFVCLLGVGVVFVGLICIIGIISIMNAICYGLASKKTAQPAPVKSEVPASAPAAPIENKQEIIAAVCAAVAEENGTDISAIRVISFKKIN